jgi:hypothetical protein
MSFDEVVAAEREREERRERTAVVIPLPGRILGALVLVGTTVAVGLELHDWPFAAGIGGGAAALVFRLIEGWVRRRRRDAFGRPVA